VCFAALCSAGYVQKRLLQMFRRRQQHNAFMPGPVAADRTEVVVKGIVEVVFAAPGIQQAS
jgi:uncharacterized membrane protein